MIGVSLRTYSFQTHPGLLVYIAKIATVTCIHTCSTNNSNGGSNGNCLVADAAYINAVTTILMLLLPFSRHLLFSATL